MPLIVMPLYKKSGKSEFPPTAQSCSSHFVLNVGSLMKSSKRNVFKASVPKITMLLKTFFFCIAVVGSDGYSAGFLPGVPHHFYTLKRLRTKC